MSNIEEASHEALVQLVSEICRDIDHFTHDLVTILASVTAMCEFNSRDTEASREISHRARYSEEIKQNCTQASILIRMLREYSATVMGTPHWTQRQRFQLRRLMTKAVGDCQAYAKWRSVTVQIEEGECINSAVLEGDEGLLYLALSGILTYAAGCAVPKSYVLVRVQNDVEQAYRFSVHFAGSHIDKNEQHRLFHIGGLTRVLPAGSLHSAHCFLPVARAVIERHGGHMHVESRLRQEDSLIADIELAATLPRQMTE